MTQKIMKNHLQVLTSLLIAALSLGTVSIDAASAFEENAHCLDIENEFSDCKIVLQDNLLNIEYEDDEDADLSRIIPLDRITFAASIRYFKSGFFESSGVESGIFFDYLDDENQTQMQVLELDPREGFIFLSLLRKNGVEVNWNLLSQ